jgi:hypothetical protein
MALFRKSSGLHILKQKDSFLGKASFSAANCPPNWKKQMKMLQEKNFKPNELSDHLPEWKKSIMRKESTLPI